MTARQRTKAMYRTVIQLFLMQTLIFFSACTSEQSRALKDLESYIQSRPDSALAVLRTLDTTALNTRSLRAHYALLHAMALDKNWIDTADVDVVMPAVEYYSQRKAAEPKAKSYYYLGRIQENSGNLANAIASLMKARSHAENLPDSRFKALICGTISSLHRKSSDYEEAFLWEKRAFDNCINARDSVLANSSRYGMAMALQNMGHHEEADSLYRQIIADSSAVFPPLYPTILEGYALLNVSKKDFETACRLYEQALSHNRTLGTANAWGAYAYSLIQIGRQEQGDAIFRQLEQGGQSSFFSYLHWKSQAEAAAGNYPEAYALLRQSADKQNENLQKILRQSVSKAQRDLFEQDSIQKKRENFLYRILLLLEGVLLLLGGGILFFIIRHKREQEESFIEATRKLAQRADHFQRERNSLQNNYVKLQQAHFQELGNLYKSAVKAELSNNIIQQKIFFEKIKKFWKMIASEQDEEKIFEQQINTCFDNVMVHLRAELPGHGESYYQFACFVFAGFDRELIMSLTQSSAHSVYSRKKRLRRDIIDADTPHKDQFLRLLS